MAVARSAQRRQDGAGELGPQLTQSIDRALTILEAFSAARPELGVQELAANLALTASTVSRILATLASRGYVQQDPASGRFSLGVRALELGYSFAATDELILRAAPHLDALAAGLNMTVHLYGLDRGQLIRYLSVQNPPRQSLTGGFRFYAHTTASGKVLLASVEPAELERIVAKYGLPPATPRSITRIEDLRADLDAIRHRGYGIDNEESRLSTMCLASPVRDGAGRTIAALSVSGSLSRFQEELRPRIIEMLFDRADQLGQAMGYVPSQAV